MISGLTKLLPRPRVQALGTRSARPDLLSREARERGAGQLESLGSENHFLEIQVVDKIIDPA
ncbi:MAG: RtcB family protein, partial [Actinomycetota bacterium]|nr:RtcB family protein [Actinomycetota bacterium]